MESLTSPVMPQANGSSALPSVDPIAVLDHLVAVLQVTLGATRKDLEELGSLLSKPRYADTVSRCTRFATESQVALYVQKDIVDRIVNVEDNAGHYSLTSIEDFVYTDRESSTNAILIYTCQ